ncbi:hypothetical protein N7508_003873 [Penicillium antarcticum]|uniref:uncharacterized protein n=1 Tax=Penicillium antarcticum TaxID=416450 RepID=UPI00238EDAA7|nr:uncharacterized protein N7508_003873 [Penicillium antarcticum]KAJ5313043.1 hypothetical protein N7508_003873 [Penicillium antarcticum]
MPEHIGRTDLLLLNGSRCLLLEMFPDRGCARTFEITVFKNQKVFEGIFKDSDLKRIKEV